MVCRTYLVSEDMLEVWSPYLGIRYLIPSNSPPLQKGHDLIWTPNRDSDPLWKEVPFGTSFGPISSGTGGHTSQDGLIP